MSWMSDERYELMQDTKEKAHTARSSKNRRGHCGKGGSVSLPSDRLTKKQMQALNGECKSYHLGRPMSWDDFCKMPDDLKALYVKKLRKNFNLPDEEFAVAMGIDIQIVIDVIKTLGVGLRSNTTGIDNWYDTEDRNKFQDWWIISEEGK